MKTQPDVTLHPIALDLDQATATLKFLYQLVERLETDYYRTLKQHQQQHLPGIPKTPANDPPCNDQLPF
jgi:hypothetical protein